MQSDVSIWLKLAIDPRRSPQLFLAGLERWLELGLISDAEVRRQCSEFFTCSLVASPVPQGVSAPTSRLSAATAMPPQASRPTEPTPLEALGVSLAAEFSLNWLLALGVFVVVVSSGALAASQWQRVSNIGQYAILWSYTLAFWGAGWWTGRSEKLRLTSRMVRAAALFLVPLNFWAADGLNLWNSGWGWGLTAIATASLISLEVWLLRPRLPMPVWGCGLMLCGLHWGWGLSGWPLVATYLGALFASLGFWISDRAFSRTPLSPQMARYPNASVLGRSILTVGMLLLLARAVLDPQIATAQLGLAIGMFGWQVGWLARSRSQPQLWLAISGIASLVGWRLTVLEVPLQALVISALVLWLLGDRLRRMWQVADLLLLFAVTVQGWLLVWQSLPAIFRQWVLEGSVQLFGPIGMPTALVGLGLLPMVWVSVAGAEWLKGQQQSRLAVWLDRVTLGFGGVLTLLALWNPGVRSLHLLLSAGTLAVVTRRQSPATLFAIYLTHIASVLTVLSGIDAMLPEIGPQSWGAILVGLAIAEFISIAHSAKFVSWRRSAWYVGLALGFAGYSAFFVAAISGDSTWGLLWLAVPVTAALLSQRVSEVFRISPIVVTIAGLLLGQLLTLGSPEPRLTGLAIGMMVMAGLTLRQPKTEFASLAIGFGLAFAAAGFWQMPPNPPEMTAWMLALSAVALLLWILQGRIDSRGKLGTVLGVASHGWATALAGLNLLLLLSYTVGLYVNQLSANGVQVGAAGLIVVAIAVRASKQFGWLEALGLAVSVELAGASAISLASAELIPLAIFNLGLALALQMGGDLWVQRTRQSYATSSHVIPAIYASWGFLLSLSQFGPYSSLYTLVLAVVFVGLGRRLPHLKPLTIAGLAAISLAAYQWVMDQLLRVSGGELGDGVGILAGLAIVIACIYQLLPDAIGRYLRFSRSTLSIGGGIHWGTGSLLLLAALPLSASDTGRWIWVGSAVVAATSAVARGRERSPSDEANKSEIVVDGWTYGGIIWGAIAIAYGLVWMLPEPTLLFEWGGAIAAASCLPLWLLPWQRWGWLPHPWHRSAIVLPGLVVGITATAIGWQSLLLVAADYAWLALRSRRIRLSYIALLFADWGLLQLLGTAGWLDAFWAVFVLGGAGLYAAQVDPAIATPEQRETRHWLRCLLVALICLTCAIELETSTGQVWAGVGLGLGVAIAGLGLRVRAYLYVGSAVFAIALLRQTWLAISDSSVALWSIGITLGVTLIWIAATFEARRDSTMQTFQSWSAALRHWE